VLRVLLDTNVVLDWLLDRKPWTGEALPVWQARDSGLLTTYIPASVLTDIFYIARRQVGESAALTAVDRSLALEIEAVDKTILQRARALPGADFEDDIGMACAEAERMDCTITRNMADVQQSPVTAMEPLALPKHLINP
jgi:predicted nucleic acid-binding protein